MTHNLHNVIVDGALLLKQRFYSEVKDAEKARLFRFRRLRLERRSIGADFLNLLVAVYSRTRLKKRNTICRDGRTKSRSWGYIAAFKELQAKDCNFLILDAVQDTAMAASGIWKTFH